MQLYQNKKMKFYFKIYKYFIDPSKMLDPTTMLTSQHHLMSTLNFQLLKNFSTGNWIIDTILPVVFLSLLTPLIDYVKSFLDKISKYVSYYLDTLSSQLAKLYRHLRGYKVIVTRHITVPFLPEDKQVNELYKAVHWYLSNHEDVNYNKDTNMEYVYSKKIAPENKEYIKNNMTIGKLLSGAQYKKVLYIAQGGIGKGKEYTITYNFETKLITLYTDKERKRENYIIHLWVDVDELCTNDILEEFCQMCIQKYLASQENKKWEQKIYRNEGDEWKETSSNNRRKMNTVILKNSIKKNIMDDFALFTKSEEWYLEKDIPWKRGYIFYGPPGTGKTSVCKAMSLQEGRHIHDFNLSTVKDDNQLKTLCSKIDYSKTIVIFEDIDRFPIVQKKKAVEQSSSESLYVDQLTEIIKKLDEKDDNKSKHNTPGPSEPGVTLSGLLNVIDGFDNHHGRIMIMTANHPDTLDDALIRPGRVDSKYLFDKCDKEQIKELFQMFFEIEVDEKKLENISPEKYTPAHIASVFLRYRNNPEDALDHLDDDIMTIQSF